jgi:hypothetical protein
LGFRGSSEFAHSHIIVGNTSLTRVLGVGARERRTRDNVLDIGLLFLARRGAAG